MVLLKKGRENFKYHRVEGCVWFRMVRPQVKSFDDVHFMVGLLVEYLREVDRKVIQTCLDNIQNIYDQGKEDTIFGLREILINLRKIEFYYSINTYHYDLLEMVIDKLEQKIQKFEGLK